MDKTHYERRSHEQGNYEITPKYDAENHYYSQKITNSTDSINMAEFPIHFGFTDIPIGGTSSSGNIVEYEFPPYSDESIVFPGNPGGGSGLNPGGGSGLNPGTEEGGLH